MSTITATAAPQLAAAKPKPAFAVLGAISTSHMINDMMQSLILAMYPILKGEFQLSFSQIGLITLANQLTASLLQPFVGHAMVGRLHPKPEMRSRKAGGGRISCRAKVCQPR